MECVGGKYLEPVNLVRAQWWNQCPECKSWRIQKLLTDKPDGSNLECYNCEYSFKEKTVSKCRYCQFPFYKENLIHVIKTGRCEECNTDNILPEELVEYADPDGKIRKEL